MDRKLRREVSKRKWLSRARRIYNSYSKYYIPVRDIKTGILAFKACESISNFLDLSKCAKILKNCTTPFRDRKNRSRYKKESRKKRYSAKKDIINGIQEYEERYDD